jgi:hypothetical protein
MSRGGPTDAEPVGTGVVAENDDGNDDKTKGEAREGRRVHVRSSS